MEANILIKQGNIVTAQNVFVADIAVRDERIIAIGTGLPESDADRIIDADGLFVLPGVVDPHTHIQLDTGIYRTADDWAVGTRVAAAGGVTTVIDFATQFPGQTVREGIRDRHDEVGDKALIDYSLHCMLTDLPAGDAELRQWHIDLLELGVPASKLYTTYRPNYYQDDANLLRAFRAAAATGVLTMMHAENDAMVSAETARLVAAGQTGLAYHGSARPALAEAEAVHRLLFLAEAAKAPLYVVHSSTAQAVTLIGRARRRGQPVMAESCPQYLFLDEDLYAGPHPERVIMQPPLRSRENVAQEQTLLQQGWINSIGTDHCEYTLAQKTAVNDFTKTPGGIPGLETSLPLLFTFARNGHLLLTRLVQLMATNPAHIFGLFPRKGTLQPGSDADMVLYDPNGTRTITAGTLHGVSGYTPYEGMPVSGRVRMTISRGRIVYDDGAFPTTGGGHFVPGTPVPPAELPW